MSRFNFLDLSSRRCVNRLAMAHIRIRPTRRRGGHGGGGGSSHGSSGGGFHGARLKAAIPTVDMRRRSAAATRAAAKGAGGYGSSRGLAGRGGDRSRPWFILGESLELFRAINDGQWHSFGNSASSSRASTAVGPQAPPVQV